MLRDKQTCPAVIAGCGHEVYDGEYIFEKDGKTLCPDCIEKHFDMLPREVKALFLDWSYITVDFSKGGHL